MLEYFVFHDAAEDRWHVCYEAPETWVPSSVLDCPSERVAMNECNRIQREHEIESRNISSPFDKNRVLKPRSFPNEDLE
jgi:hypothetical protein